MPVALASLAGAAVSGMLLGTASGVLGSLLGQSRVWVALGLATAIAVGCVTKVKVPQLNREAPQSLLSLDGRLWGFTNGFIVGSGPATRIAFWTWYLLPAAALIQQSMYAAVLVWTVYSVMRIFFGIIQAAMIRFGWTNIGLMVVHPTAVSVAARTLGLAGVLALAVGVLTR